MNEQHTTPENDTPCRCAPCPFCTREAQRECSDARCHIAPGSRVRIVADEHPRLIGLTGTITEFGSDGTTAWVESGPSRGVWCSVSNLSVVPPEVPR
jgi:hypothetical protein